MKQSPCSLPGLLFLLCVALVAGCASVDKASPPTSEMDTPEHHYEAGMGLLDGGDLEGSAREFDRAIALDPEFSPAYAGRAVVAAKQGKVDDSREALKAAQKCAGDDGERALVQVATIRVLTEEKGPKWIKQAEDAFAKAVKIEPGNAAAHYFMGCAYRSGDMPAKSISRFQSVISMEGDYVGEADEAWKKMQRMIRAAAGTEEGVRIAKIEAIDRADLAALLIEELALEKLFEQYGVDPPEEVAAGALTDYANHVLREDIGRAVALELRGLEAISARDGAGKVTEIRFEPDRRITRAEYAMAIEDILMRITSEGDLAAKHIGQNSLFHDVEESSPFFNAVMVCTARGVMSGDLEGYFHPKEPVSGADALLIIRQFKERLP